jgi:hypothetical protein
MRVKSRASEAGAPTWLLSSTLFTKRLPRQAASQGLERLSFFRGPIDSVPSIALESQRDERRPAGSERPIAAVKGKL